MCEAVLQAPAPDTKAALEPAVKKVRKKRAPKHDFKDGRGKVFAHRHVFGGGWVEDTAQVADSVYVGRYAQIWNNAVLENSVRVENYAKVAGNAYLRDYAMVLNFSFVAGNAVLYDRATTKNHATIYGGIICGNSVVQSRATVRGSVFIRGSTISGNSQIRDRSTVFNSTVNGTSRLQDNAYVADSVLSGLVLIRDSAKVIASDLCQSRGMSAGEESDLLISDNVMIVNCAQLNAIAHIRGTTKIVGGSISFSPEYDGITQRYRRAVTITQAIFPGASISSRDDFNRYNDPDINRRAGTAQALLAARQLQPQPLQIEQRQPFDFAAARGRRIMPAGDN